MSDSLQKIVAIDLGKFKSVACVMDAATQAHQFETIETTPAALGELLARHMTADRSKTLVVVEACDVAGWVHDLCVAHGVPVVVANANAEAWRWCRVKRKTDRDDALKLARLTLLKQLPFVHMPDAPSRQKRRLMVHRRSLVDGRTRHRNQVRSIFSQQGLQLAKGGKQWTIAGVAQLKEHARPIEECDVDNLWRGRLHVELQLMRAVDQQLKIVERTLDDLADDRTKLLRTLKGVGPRLAEAAVLYLDDPRRFKSAEEVASYAGLVPKQIESGQMKRMGRITHRGPALLRALLVESAWTVWKYNAWAQTFVAKISGGNRGRRKTAIVALARKVLTILWAMLRTNTPFRSPVSANEPTPECV